MLLSALKVLEYAFSASLSISSLVKDNSFVLSPPASIKASSFLLLKSSTAFKILLYLNYL